jgi:hypothetical protein
MPELRMTLTFEKAPWPMKPKILILWFFTGKACWALDCSVHSDWGLIGWAYWEERVPGNQGCQGRSNWVGLSQAHAELFKKKKKNLQLVEWLKWKSACPASVRSWGFLNFLSLIWFYVLKAAQSSTSLPMHSAAPCLGPFPPPPLHHPDCRMPAEPTMHFPTP